MIKYMLSGFMVLAIIGAAISAPFILSKYQDKKKLGIIYTLERKELESGYQYEMTNDERLFNFSKYYTNSLLLQKDSMIPAIVSGYPKKTTAVMAINKPLEGIAPEQAANEIDRLKQLKILPEFDFDEKDLRTSLYELNDIALANNMLIWEADTKNGRFYIDAHTGKIYSFFADIKTAWEDIDIDSIMKYWCKYLEINEASEYLGDASEKTPYYKKYELHMIEDTKIILTIGYYPGRNTVFLRTNIAL